MGDDLPTEYDCIVIGTGMTESIVAAAASRIGKRVLHLDINEYYGGLWASFNLDGLQTWLDDCRKVSGNVENNADAAVSPGLVKDGETTVKAGNQISTICNIEEKWHIAEGRAESLVPLSSKNTQTDLANMELDAAGNSKPADETEKLELDLAESEKLDGTEKEVASLPQPTVWTRAKFMADHRRFNLDLAPKLLFARGALVELLISSNIARYAEFRSVTRVLTYLGDQLEAVPCSRADVFATRHVSVVEKRMLMKLLSACLNYDANNANEFEGFEEKTFLDYLKSKKLTPNLIHYVLYAISMSTDSTPCPEGVTRTKRFLNSLGRYGNTPFLWPMYGSGEIPQCFCRLCAVFGGMYHLKRSAQALIVGPGEAAQNKCRGIVSNNQRLEATQLVLGVGFTPAEFLNTVPTGGLSRGVFVTDGSVLPIDKETLTLLRFPALEGKCEAVTVIELGPSTNACPQGLYVVHMTCKQTATAREDLEVAVNKLLDSQSPASEPASPVTLTQATQTGAAAGGGDSGDQKEKADASDKPETTGKKPRVLWSLYFNCPDTSACDLSTNVPDNVFLCSGPDMDLDFDFAVQQAQQIFTKMYPEEEFLPRAPDPEEIILEGEETVPGPSFDEATGTTGQDIEKETNLEELENVLEAMLAAEAVDAVEAIFEAGDVM